MTATRYGVFLRPDPVTPMVPAHLTRRSSRWRQQSRPRCCRSRSLSATTSSLPVAENTFWGHLSVVSHDLLVDPHLADEVGEFLAGLPLRPPPTFTAEVYSLYAFESDWLTEWWRTLSWRHVRSWNVTRRLA